MKTVFPSNEVYHVWAHQKAPAGRAKGTHVYFRGPVIYSYGEHFPMAKLILKGGKPVAVLVTTRRYSNTTSQHQSGVRRAVSHLRRFYVHDVTASRKVHLKDYKERIEDSAEWITKAKAKTLSLLSELRGLIAEANAYAKFFGLKTKFDMPEGFDEKAHTARGEEEKKKADERLRKQREAYEKRHAAELAKARAEYPAKLKAYTDKVAAWVAGTSNEIPRHAPRDPDNETWFYEPTPVYLRVRGSRIETSLGAVFQIESARPILALVRRRGKGGLVNPDMAVDGYRGVSIDYDKKTVSVGCHTVAFAEVKRIAEQLGLWGKKHGAQAADGRPVRGEPVRGADGGQAPAAAGPGPGSSAEGPDGGAQAPGLAEGPGEGPGGGGGRPA